MPACHAPTPLDLVVEVALLQHPRMVCADSIARFALPIPAPLFCNNWPSLLPCCVDRAALMRIPDLRGHLLARLEGLILQQTNLVDTSPQPWARRASLHRDLYEQVR